MDNPGNLHIIHKPAAPAQAHRVTSSIGCADCATALTELAESVMISCVK
jgi:hypothetical protein